MVNSSDLYTELKKLIPDLPNGHCITLKLRAGMPVELEVETWDITVNPAVENRRVYNLKEVKEQLWDN